MNSRSLLYVVVAVAVGYLLISAIPQQVAMYTTPQSIISSGESADPRFPNDEWVLSPESIPESVTEDMEEIKSFGTNGKPVKPSLIEYTRLSDLLKWWTFDVIIAITIYWIARRRML